MDKQGDISVQNQRTVYDSDGSESDDNYCVLEERLETLLSADRKGMNQIRNIFSDFQEQTPKLRRTEVVRALKDIFSSTPITTGNKRTFFQSEPSVNISPINYFSAGLQISRSNKDAENESMHTSQIQCCYITNPDKSFETAVNKKHEMQKRSNTRTSKKIVDSFYETSKSGVRSNLSGESQFQSAKRCRQGIGFKKSVTNNLLLKPLNNSSHTTIETDKQDLTESNQFVRRKRYRQNLTPADLGYPDSLTSDTDENSRTIINQLSESYCENMDKNKRNKLDVIKNQLLFSGISIPDHTSGILSNNVSTGSDKNTPETYPITSLIAEISERKKQSHNAIVASKRKVQNMLHSMKRNKSDLKQKEKFQLNSVVPENEVATHNSFGQHFSSEMSPREHSGMEHSNNNFVHLIHRIDDIDRVMNLRKSCKALGQSIVTIEDTPKRKRIGKGRLVQIAVNDNESITEITNNSGGCGTIVGDMDEVLKTPSKNEEVPASTSFIRLLNQDELFFKGEEKSLKEANKKYEKRIDVVESQQVTIDLNGAKISSKVAAKKRNNKVVDVQLDAHNIEVKSLKPIPKKKATNNGLPMEDSDKPTALRRSERTRRPPLRRMCYGVVVTYSERVFNYFNGSSKKPAEMSELYLLNVQKASKPQITKKNITRNKQNGKENRDNKNISNGKKTRKLY